MRASILALLVAVLLGASGASAQAFTVVGTQPADHAVSVPLQATLSFTFSERVLNYPGALDSEPILVVFPADAIAIGEPTRSADGLTLSFPAALQANTRYVALLLGADSEANARLSRAEALNFTTGASNGGFTVRGSVRGTSGLLPDGAIVALATGDLTTGDIQIVAADVVSGGASALPYTLGPVPLGLYTAGAILVPLPIGSTSGFGYGLYDPDGDGTPNPIFGTTGVDVVLEPPPAFIAGDGIPDAQAAADGALGGPSLLTGIGPAIVDDMGASAAWTYRFFNRDASGVVDVIRLGLFTLPLPPGLFTLVGSPIQVPLLGDSDAALARAEAQGGAAFRAQHPDETITVTMQLMAISDAELWTVTYAASGGATETVSVIYGISSGEAGPDRAPRRLALASANPGRGAVEARLALDAPAQARIRVVDAQGRTVATLLDARLGAGEHTVRWTEDTPVGMFWIVADADGRTEAVAVTRVR